MKQKIVPIISVLFVLLVAAAYFFVPSNGIYGLSDNLNQAYQRISFEHAMASKSSPFDGKEANKAWNEYDKIKSTFKQISYVLADYLKKNKTILLSDSEIANLELFTSDEFNWKLLYKRTYAQGERYTLECLGNKSVGDFLTMNVCQFTSDLKNFPELNPQILVMSEHNRDKLLYFSNSEPKMKAINIKGIGVVLSANSIMWLTDLKSNKGVFNLMLQRFIDGDYERSTIKASLSENLSKVEQIDFNTEIFIGQNLD